MCVALCCSGSVFSLLSYVCNMHKSKPMYVRYSYSCTDDMSTAFMLQRTEEKTSPQGSPKVKKKPLPLPSTKVLVCVPAFAYAQPLKLKLFPNKLPFLWELLAHIRLCTDMQTEMYEYHYALP